MASSRSTPQDFFCDLEGDGTRERADTAVEAVDQGNFSKLKARMEALPLRRLIGTGRRRCVGRNKHCVDTQAVSTSATMSLVKELR